MMKRKELEMKVLSDEVLLKEVKDSLNTVLRNLDKTTSKRLGQDKELLEFLTSDMSDERILADGIKRLKKHIAGSKSRKNLPLAAEVDVTRLLNKFDGLTNKEFVEVLEGKKQRSSLLVVSEDAEQTEQKEVYVEKMDSVKLRESDKGEVLNRSSCGNILVQWLQLSEENDTEQLLGRIKVYESKLSAEMVLKYQEELKRKRITSDPDEMQILKEGVGPHEYFEKPYGSQPGTQSLHGLPDALSQFMHQLEGLKMVIGIDRKVDQMSAVLERMEAATTNSSHENKQESNNFHGNEHDSYNSHGSKQESNGSHGNKQDSYSSHGSEQESNGSHGNKQDSYSSHGSTQENNGSHGNKQDSYSSHGSKQESNDSHANEEDNFSKQVYV